VFDDIHWGEPTFLDLVEHLADWIRDAAVLLLCVARPELLDVRPGWGGGKLNATSILLEPLDEGASSRLVDNLLGSADIPDAARERILLAAEGNPLFVEEMLGMLIDDGLLRFQDGTWRAVDDLADLTVPPTIQLLLAARIDRLDAEERAVMERGAVEGKVFHTGAVATLASERLRPNVRTRLLALARKELIRPDRAEFAGEDAFRFRHLLIRDAAYQAMPKEQRADLHERYAAWLEGAAGDRVAEYEEILAYHLERAYRYRLELGPADERALELASAAARRFRSSAERAVQRGDYAAARRLMERAVDLLEGSERARARVELAIMAGQHHDFQASAALAREAMEEAEEAGDRVALLRARLVAAASAGQIDPTYTLARAKQEGVDALAELEALGDERGIVFGMLFTAWAAFYDGQCGKATEIAERLLERRLTLSARESRDVSAALLVSGYFGMADPEKLGRIAERVKELLKVEGPLAEVTLTMNAMARSSLRGLEAETVAHADRLGHLWEEIANPGLAVAHRQGLGECLRRVGRLEEAEQALRHGVEALDRLGEVGFNSTMTALLAEVLCDLGRWEEADRHVERSREMTAADDFASQVSWRIARARSLEFAGRREEALVLVDEAAEVVDVTEYLEMRAMTHEVRGQVLAALGRNDEARSEIVLCLQMYERKGSMPYAERARRRLAELPS
jgi:hypothetical protein